MQILCSQSSITSRMQTAHFLAPCLRGVALHLTDETKHNSPAVDVQRFDQSGRRRSKPFSTLRPRDRCLMQKSNLPHQASPGGVGSDARWFLSLTFRLTRFSFQIRLKRWEGPSHQG